jgi:EAL domain-containing protein (putative c-di-GMP-specific phosphodiesterase class I)
MNVTDKPIAQHGGFGHRRVVPRVTIFDPKPYARIFLAEMFDDLGFIPQCCAKASEIVPSLDAGEPDLFVIVVSDDAAAAENVLDRLAAELFCGSIVLIGSLPMLAGVQQLGEQLGLIMRPLLGTPFRKTELTQRIADLLPTAPPPPLPVDLIDALGNNWLELWYQPKIDPRALTVCGAEALIRLRHPTWGVVPPARFLPEKGDPHFRALSDFVVLKAMADWMRFATDHVPVELAVNLPAAVLADPDFVRRMRRQLPHHPAFDRLVVEIEASELIGDVVPVREIVRELGSCGVGVSIADLGAECASLTGLEGFPIVELKVARQVINGCAQDRLKRALCGTILDVARRIGARTVAEGVETRADFIAVREIGFDLAQGFMFGKPMEARKFGRTLRRPLTMPT